MNTLDIIILILVLVPALLGLRKGLLRGIFSLAGIVLGLFLATRYNDQVSSLFSFLKFDPKLLSLVSFIFIIVMCYFVLTFLAGKISRINILTKSIDKILGAVLGILKGLIIASLFLILTTNTFNFFSRENIQASRFYSIVINVAPDTYDFVKQFFPDAKNFYEELNKLIPI